MTLTRKCSVLISRVITQGFRRSFITSSVLRCDAERTDENSNENPEEDIKANILQSALDFVPEYGWSRKSIIKGAEAAGYPTVTHGVFSRGAIDLVFHFYATANEELLQQLQAENQAVKDGIMEKKKINVFVRDAVEMRLRLLSPYISTWPQAMGLMALPPNAPEALSHLGTLVDNIWYEVGDRSTDFNYYTKRASLAWIYKLTELHMIQDKSEDFSETWKFLDRRLANLAIFGKFVRDVSSNTDKVGDLIWSSFLTARNIFGVNDRQR